jgi:hypothetical protein
MAAWRREFPEDVQAELEFYRSKRADRRRRKAFINAQLAGPTTTQGGTTSGRSPRTPPQMTMKRRS